jgi:hypothetical protein
VHDVKLLEPTLDQIVIDRPDPARRSICAVTRPTMAGRLERPCGSEATRRTFAAEEKKSRPSGATRAIDLDDGWSSEQPPG